jgi:hypothetical protein
MNDGEEPVHFIRNVFEVRRDVVSDVNWLLAIPTSELSDIRYGCIVQGPKSVFVECLDAFFYADLNAVGK